MGLIIFESLTVILVAAVWAGLLCKVFDAFPGFPSLPQRKSKADEHWPFPQGRKP